MPYRELHVGCPTCRNELREHEGRLVCDACNGILMSVADFEAAILDLGGQAVTLRLGAVNAAACPRCERLLHQTTLVVDGKDVFGEVAACAHHGVWFDGGGLERAFVEIGRRTSMYRSRGGAFVGVGGTGSIYPKLPFRTAREALDPPMRPRTRTPYKPMLAGSDLQCPRCAGVLQLDALRWTCADHGAFVEHAAFAEMVEELTRQVWEPVWRDDAASGGPCPACGEAMTVQAIAGAAVERCAAHGLWFDGGKLEDALGGLTRPRPGWLRRLFR